MQKSSQIIWKQGLVKIKLPFAKQGSERIFFSGVKRIFRTKQSFITRQQLSNHYKTKLNKNEIKKYSLIQMWCVTDSQPKFYIVGTSVFCLLFILAMPK